MEQCKLDVTIPRSLKEDLKREAKEQNKLFGGYVTELLQKARKPKPIKAIRAVDPEVEQVIAHFEKQVAKVRSHQAALKPVREMLEEHGFNKVIGAINAVAYSKGMDYAPVIASLPTLQEKWHNLDHFTRRKVTKVNSRVFSPTVK